MRIAGWKTASVFKRYAIVDQRNIRAALQQLERDQGKWSKRANGSGSRLEYTPLSQPPLAVC
jgi:hypothetical protein